MPVVTTLELDDLVTPGESPRETNRTHGCFSTRTGHTHQINIWHQVTDALRKPYLERMSRMGMTLEIELGITGGEEDGVDHSDVDSARLYTQPEEVAYAYREQTRLPGPMTWRPLCAPPTPHTRPGAPGGRRIGDEFFVGSAS